MFKMMLSRLGIYTKSDVVGIIEEVAEAIISESDYQDTHIGFTAKLKEDYNE